MTSWALYGATGYTGKLIVEEAVKRGHRPLLLGRSEQKLRAVADPHGLPSRAVPLDDPGGLRAAIDGVKLVLHAAGPFVKTWEPMVNACLDVKAHYLDITGELAVFEQVYARDDEAAKRGVCLISGVGFDVVPTDCLAMHVVQRVKRPRRLEIAIAAIGQPSGGTAASVIEMLPRGFLARRGGKLVSIPPLKGSKKVQFPEREATVVPAPLADLVSAYHSTAVEDISCYLAVPKRVGKLARSLWPVAAAAFPIAQAVLRHDRLREKLGARVQVGTEGPTAEQRAKSRSFIWARVEADGGGVESTLSTIEGYDFTKMAAVRILERVLKTSPTGAKSPGQVVGKDFVLELPQTTRVDR